MRKLIVSLFIITLVAAGIAAASHTFKAKLLGKEDAVKTTARGEAVFKLEKGGTELAYDLKVKSIENVTAAHIHYGKKGENGAPVVSLSSAGKKEGKFSSELSKGMITPADLYGVLQGKSIEDVVKMIKAGELYVNVHTDKHPNGEIRGQIRS